MKIFCGSALLIGVSGFGGTTETAEPSIVPPIFTPSPAPVVVPTMAPEIVWPPTMGPEIVWPPTMGPEIVWPPTVAPEIVWPPTMAPEVVWPPVVDPVGPEPVVTDVTGRSCAGKCFQSKGRENLPVLESYQEYTIIEGPDGALFQVRSMCSCDTECERFGDCCNDYTAVCLAEVVTGEWTGTTDPAGEWVVSPTGELVWSTDVQTSVVSETTGQWVQSASGEWVWSTSTEADVSTGEEAAGRFVQDADGQWVWTTTGTLTDADVSTGGEWSSTQAAGQFVQDADGKWVWTTTGTGSLPTETIMYPSTTIVNPAVTETSEWGGQWGGEWVQSSTGEWEWTATTSDSSQESAANSQWTWTPASSSSMRKAGPSGFLRGKRTEPIPVVATTIVSTGDNVNYVCQNKRAIIGNADMGAYDGVSSMECEQKCSDKWGCQSYTFDSRGYCELWSIPDTSVASTTHNMCNKGDDGTFACQMNRAIEGLGQLQFFETGFSEERCKLACKNNEKCKSLVWGQGSCKLWSIHEYSVDHQEYTTCSKK